jgi:hypothetical protein
MDPVHTTPPHLTALRDELSGREPIFHRPEHGTGREALEAMTDKSFWEIGASGRRYSRQHVIDTVVRRYAAAIEDPWRAEDFHCQEIAQDNYLLTYTLHQGDRVTCRSTLWRRAPAGWKIVFHQGTVVEAPYRERRATA